jgi:hypothetical protein
VIREPTGHDEQYAWHRNAMLGVFGKAVTLFNEEPECGWFKRRLVKGGVFVPARIWLVSITDCETGELTQDEFLQCEVNGNYADVDQQWPWLCGNPISESEFNYMTALRQHCAWHAPDEPAANPRQPINWNTVKPPEFRREA